jgi:hypothetical protein
MARPSPVKSKKGAAHTIIDGGMNGSVVTFNSGETVSATLSGFTIQNGSGTSNFGSPETEGGGIETSNASPEISENVITRNYACGGAGINITNFGSPLIKQNKIVLSSSGSCSSIGGGGITILGGGAPRIIGNTISQNLQPYSDGGGGISIFYMTGVATIENNVITGNTGGASGGGISAVNQADANVVQNIISQNTAGAGAGIFWSVPSGTRGPFLVNNTIVDSTNTQTCLDCPGSALYMQGFFSQSLLVNNLFIGARDKRPCSVTRHTRRNCRSASLTMHSAPSESASRVAAQPARIPAGTFPKTRSSWDTACSHMFFESARRPSASV